VTQAMSLSWRERLTEPRWLMPSGLVYIRRNACVLRRRRGDADSLFAKFIERVRCEPPRIAAWEGEALGDPLSGRRVVNAPSISDARSGRFTKLRSPGERWDERDGRAWALERGDRGRRSHELPQGERRWERRVQTRVAAGDDPPALSRPNSQFAGGTPLLTRQGGERFR
jgi:hypothetical protein